MNWLKSLGLDTLKLPPLAKGSHKDPSSGLCAMEMVAFMERLPHSDRPECTSPVVAALVIWINDTLMHDERNALLMPMLPRVVGTVAPEFERVRQYAILQAVFDMVVRLERPSILPPRKWLHDPGTGLRVAFPPWDYAHTIGRDSRDDLQRLSPSPAWCLGRLLDCLRDSLVARDPVDSVEYAFVALQNLREIADTVGHWAREPLYSSPDTMRFSVSKDGALDATEITIRDYRPNWTEWRMQLLEQVLAIGPKAKGFTGTHEQVIERVDALAELV